MRRPSVSIQAFLQTRGTFREEGSSRWIGRGPEVRSPLPVRAGIAKAAKKAVSESKGASEEGSRVGHRSVGRPAPMTDSRAQKLLRSLPHKKAAFVEPMDCLAVAKLPDGPNWLWEIKLDGYRAIAVKSGGAVTLYSRNRKILNKRFPYIVEPLRGLPEGTVVDGEIVALDDDGRPVFNLLQNFTSEAGRVRYFVFDLLCYENRDLTGLPLLKRRDILHSLIKFDGARVKISEFVEASAEQMLSAVREQRLEGIVGKRKDSVYEPGKRSGAWIKHRVNLGQEFVVGGFTPGPHGLDAIIVGYYRGDDLVYTARTRNGFVPASRRRVFEKLRPLVISECPFVNLPETHKARWGEALTVEKMKKCVWVRPEVVAQIEFLEWTDGDRLRHSKFVGLRDDKDPRKIAKEQTEG
jgi:DNA ligase D-like protein (predicted ligase)